MRITAILPVSRTKYLDRVLESLLKQTRKPDGLIVVFDGNEKDYLDVRNKIVALDFENKICVPSNNKRPAFSIPERRWHIVNIHNQIRDILPENPRYVLDDYEPDWIFSIEDDGILPVDALEKLAVSATQSRNIGMFTGVELGRWGVPYVGAWHVDDVHNPQIVTSLQSRTDSNFVEEIDGCGLYCALIRQDYYKMHTFDTRNGLGPDVNLGLFLRQHGLKNYIDWSIHVTHLTSTPDGEELEIPATSPSRVVQLHLMSGSTWKA